MKSILSAFWMLAIMAGLFSSASVDAQVKGQRVYQNTLKLLKNPAPLLNDYPQFVQPIIERRRFEAPKLVDDPQGNLEVRAWRFSYNARGIIEVPNTLNAKETAVIMVHPWGIDDGQGWKTPEPAGVADFCTVEKNHLAAKHTKMVIDATKKWDYPAVSLPPLAKMREVADNWDEYGLPPLDELKLPREE